MAGHKNLADPDYEPSDEDFAELLRSAFAGLREAHEASLREMRARILVLQTEARERFEARAKADRRG